MTPAKVKQMEDERGKAAEKANPQPGKEKVEGPMKVTTKENK